MFDQVVDRSKSFPFRPRTVLLREMATGCGVEPEVNSYYKADIEDEGAMLAELLSLATMAGVYRLAER